MKSLKQKLIKKILKSKGVDELDDVERTVVIMKIVAIILSVVLLSAIISII